MTAPTSAIAALEMKEAVIEPVQVENPDEIKLEDSDEEADRVIIEEKAIPQSVFGGASEEPAKENIGALERFKRRKLNP